MKNKFPYRLIIVFFIALMSVFTFAFYVLGWEEPSSAPPDGNIDAPVNIGTDLQTKQGGFGVNGVFSAFSNVYVGGNVGINTATPIEKLQVNNGDIWANGGDVCQTNITTGETACLSTLTSVVSSPWARNGTSIYYNGGNVGIGTSNPDATLQVRKDNDSIWNIGEHPTYPGYSAIWSPGEDYTILKNSQNLYLNARGAGNIYFREDNNNLVTIANNGTVGIGTTSPARNLDVNGNIRVRSGVIDLSNDTNEQLWLDGSNNLHFKLGGADKGLLQSNGDLSTTGKICDGSGHCLDSVSSTPGGADGDMQYNNGGVFGGTNMRYDDGTGDYTISGGDFLVGGAVAASTLTSSGNAYLAATFGNVGIGTLTPSEKLDVAGDVKVNGIHIGTQYISSNIYNYNNGILITTDIAVGNNQMIELYIEGNSYEAWGPISGKVQAYNYITTGTIIQTSFTAYGRVPSEVRIFHHNGYVKFWMPPNRTFQTYRFRLATFSGSFKITNIQNSAMPGDAPPEGGGQHVLLYPKTVLDNNVGIGKTNPSEKLDVVGNIKASGTICDGSGNCLDSVSSTPGGADGDMQYNNGGVFGGTNMRYDDGTGDYTISGGDFLVGGAVAASTLTSSGNAYLAATSGGVGIGTTDLSTGNLVISDPLGGVVTIKGDGSNDNPTLKLLESTLGMEIRYDGAINSLIFKATGGTGGDMMTLNTNGNVGIGTTSPGEELEISSAVPGLKLTDSAGGYAYVYADSGNLSLRSDGGNTIANSYMNFYVDGSERMRINSSGNVGVKTTTPARDLDVNGNIRIQGGTIDLSNDTNEQLWLDGSNTLHFKLAGADRGLLQSNGNLTTTGTICDGSGNCLNSVSTNPGGVNGQMQYNSAGTFEGANVYWDPALGRLGIGTSTPADNLHVVGDMFVTTDGLVGGSLAATNLVSSSSSYFATANGNVGIGTVAPSSKLDVVGNVGGISIHATGDICTDVDGGHCLSDITVKTYDSGWFPVTSNTAYTKAHGFGKEPFMVQLWFSDDPTGSGNVIIRSSTDSDYAPNVWAYVTLSVVDVNTNDITIRSSGAPYIAVYADKNGVSKSTNSGFARIKAISF